MSVLVNIFEENFSFIVIGLMVIVVVVLAYYTFIKPKSKEKKKTSEPKETKTDQSITVQDSTNLEQTSLASGIDESTKENLEEYQSSDNLEVSKPVIIQKSNEEDNSESKTIEEEKDSSVTNEESEAKKDPSVTNEESEAEKDPSASNEETETRELGKYHIVYRKKDNKWIVKREGSDKTIRVLHTKKEAVAYATIKAINQDTNIIIHGRDGKIEKQGY